MGTIPSTPVKVGQPAFGATGPAARFSAIKQQPAADSVRFGKAPELTEAEELGPKQYSLKEKITIASKYAFANAFHLKSLVGDGMLGAVVGGLSLIIPPHIHAPIVFLTPLVFGPALRGVFALWNGFTRTADVDAHMQAARLKATKADEAE